MSRSTQWRPTLAALLGGLVLWAGDASAQRSVGDIHAGVEDAGIGDVPAGPATLRVLVVRRGGGAAGAGVDVSLFALRSDGQPGIRRGVTAADGSFSFAGIASDPSTVYLVGVRYDGVPFGARAVFAPGATELAATIEVADRSDDAGVLRPGAIQLRVDTGCSGVRVSETHSLENPSDRVLYVPLDARASAGPLLRIALPEGAASFESGGSPFDDRLEQSEGEVLVFGPLYPGDNAVSFSYALPSTATTLAIERRFPLGTQRASVLTAVGAPTAQGAGLSSAGAVEADGVRYEAVASGPLSPGDVLSFAVSVAAAAEQQQRIAFREVRTWLELDGAALDVREQYLLHVAGGESLRSQTGAPLLCLWLPPGAEEVRFSQDAFAMGIQPDAAGGVSLRGPLPAGDSAITVSYLLRSDGVAATYRQHYSAHLPVLSVYVADTGVVADTGRLHRRRPVRTSDRTYLHLEAFEIASGETVAVELTHLDAPRRLPRAASIGFVAGTALLVVGVLVGPLRRPAGAPRSLPVSAHDDERDIVIQAIHDLDDDFETGKLSASDHQLMRAELRAQAAALLRAERADRSAEAAEATPATCPGCGAAADAAARFCSQCGAALAATKDAGAPET